MWYVCDVLHVRVNCFVVRGCAVLRMYINVCNSGLLVLLHMCLDHLKFCVVCIDGRSYVCCSECYVVSNELMMIPPPAMCKLLVGTVVKVMYFGCFCFRGELGFVDCDDICMCVLNKHFELLKVCF